VSRTLQVRLMPWRPRLRAALQLRAHAGEPRERPLAEGEVVVDVTAKPEPWLQADVWLVDDPQRAARLEARLGERPADEPAFVVTGNGDGSPQPGERVLVVVEAHNLSIGPAEATRAVLRNRAGELALLEVGAIELGAIAPGKSVRAAFGLTVRDDAAIAAPIELELMVGDAHTRQVVTRAFTVAVQPPGPAPEPKNSLVWLAGGQVPVHFGPDASSPVLAELPGAMELRTEAALPGWWVVRTGVERFGYIAVDRTSDKEPLRGRPGLSRGLGAALPVSTWGLPPLLLAPRLRFGREPPRAVADEAVELELVALHPRALKDLTVYVRGATPAAIESKVAYLAVPAPVLVPSGDRPQEFRATVRVPLEPGANAVRVVARDQDEVEATREAWIVRETAAR
jgi:hypothetical protein